MLMVPRIRRDFFCRLSFLLLRALITPLHPVQVEVSFGCHHESQWTSCTRISAPDDLWCHLHFRASGLRNGNDDNRPPCSGIRSQGLIDVYNVCASGSELSFVTTLSAAGLKPVPALLFVCRQARQARKFVTSVSVVAKLVTRRISVSSSRTRSGCDSGIGHS